MSDSPARCALLMVGAWLGGTFSGALVVWLCWMASLGKRRDFEETEP